MLLATKTLEAINSALAADQGARYRGLLGEAIKECHDAFDDRYDPKPRKHLGGSLIGRPCARALWYSFRWCLAPVHEPRIIRLFNRGHLEEARFIALLRTGGMRTWHSENGKQFKISDHNGHYGGSLDGVGLACPDLPLNVPCLLEFKTHGSKSYAKLVKEGVEKAKVEHAVQCGQYMAKWNLQWSLYCGVNKDNDDLHLELIKFNQEVADAYLDRAGKIIRAETPPPKINASPAWFECKFCDMRGICHHGQPALRTCRTCIHSKMLPDGKWGCVKSGVELSADDQWQGCSSHSYLRGL